MVKDELTIFISGKEGELDDERAIANELLHSLKFKIKSSENRPASYESMRTENQYQVLNSDIYLGIFARIHSDGTILEFDKARYNDLPALIFVKEIKDDEEPRQLKLKEFLKSIKDYEGGLVYLEYKNVVDLRSKIIESLFQLLSRKFGEAIELRHEINNLKSEYETHDIPRSSELSNKLKFLWGVRYDKDFGRARIIKFDIPEKMESGKTYSTYVKINGHVKNGFLDLALIDPDNTPKYSWFPDPDSYMMSKDNGNLFIASGEHESQWNFTTGAKKGKYKAIMGIYENNYDHRVCIDYEIKEIIVT